ncbi:MAG TPA: DNA repair protein RadA [Candidatus Kapabacteria bacterium]|jgi:DNA repair protein RadA/Sms|nr:DNA repair protein RadA [Candidatus Kapabacteria bacterium]HOV91918.1 DNA repair protein RadA [Candidatus Kapabacteria bacterium]
MKSKTIFICSNCGTRSARWQGRCPTCGAWNSFVEEEIEQHPLKRTTPQGQEPILISQIQSDSTLRILTGIEEFDRVLGGGMVPGSVVLLGGDPGIGKSTLLLQVSGKFNPRNCLYITGEESLNQISLRSKRIFHKNEDLQILSETNLENIFEKITSLDNLHFVVIDSIQSISSDKIDAIAGSLLQIRECTNQITNYAKKNDITFFLIGHITKEGVIAGPKVLEHIVDTVLQFEGEKNYNYRILRTLKNRFGSTNEIGIFEMTENGMIEVKNPSEIFLSNPTDESGVAISCAIEGSRAILLEVQALVTPSNFAYPQRITNGFEIRRLQLILAVLEKRLGLNFSSRDVFINIAGGVMISDPALDLAVACALISSFKDQKLPQQTVIIGEIGLTGEVRGVSNISQRLSEIQKLKFPAVFLPEISLQKLHNKFELELTPVSNVLQTFNKIF